MKNKNFKTLNIPFHVKQDAMTEDENFYYFEGYGSTFGNLDLVGDVVVPGAFGDSLKKRMPKLLWSHDMYQMPLGKFTSAEEDQNGLYLKGMLPKNVSQSKDAGELLKMGAIDSMSIGFNTLEFDRSSDGTYYIKKVDLWETSLVNLPANPMAKVTYAKSDEQIIDVDFLEKSDIRELEKRLRDSGFFSKKAAIYMASRMKSQSESAPKEEGHDYSKCLHLIRNMIQAQTHTGETHVNRSNPK